MKADSAPDLTGDWVDPFIVRSRLVDGCVHYPDGTPFNDTDSDAEFWRHFDKRAATIAALNVARQRIALLRAAATALGTPASAVILSVLPDNTDDMQALDFRIVVTSIEALLIVSLEDANDELEAKACAAALRAFRWTLSPSDITVSQIEAALHGRNPWADVRCLEFNNDTRRAVSRARGVTTRNDDIEMGIRNMRVRRAGGGRARYERQNP